MEFKSMTVEELELRMDEIASEIDNEDADLDALETEAKGIKEELEERKKVETAKAEIRSAVAEGKVGTVVKTIEVEERKKMTLKEVRNSKEYIEAFAQYIKTNDDTECRALLTTNSDVESNPGQVPVPEYIEGRVATAWQRSRIMDLVYKTYLRGNVKKGFELSATGAAVHAEGTAAPNEETLTMGIVTMIPQSIKKWIRLSDETVDMGGQEFLDYIYDELTYRIAKEVERILIQMIIDANASASGTAVGVPNITGAPSLTVVSEAMGQLSDEASNPVIVMNKATHAAFRAAQAQGNFAFDPFEGLDVYYNNTLPSFATATNGQDWLIVGDFGIGAQANFPNGDEIRIKYDEMSEAEADLVKLVGREYVGLGLVSDKAFCTVSKAATAESTEG